MAEKGERGRNFTELEKSQLVETVLNYKELVENKRTDKVSLLTKANTWQKISEEYNAAQMTGPRETRTLKNLYETLKAKARKDKAAEKMEAMKTGGGPCPPSMSALSNRLVGEFKDQFEPLENMFDLSSIIFEKDEELDILEAPITITEDDGPIERVDVGTAPAAVVPTSTPTPTPTDGGVSRKRRRSSSEQPNVAVMETFCSEKLSVAKQRLEFMRLEHNMKMEIFRSELETARKMEEKARLEIELVKIKIAKESV